MRVALAVLLLMTACAPAAQLPESAMPSAAPFKAGIAGFVPRHFPQSTPDDWSAFFNEVPRVAGAFGDYVAWDDQPDAKGIPQQVHTASKLTNSSGMTLVLAVGFDVESQEARTYFQDHGEAYWRAAVAVAQEFHPEYLGLGVEVNRYYERSPEGFQDHGEAYWRAAVAVAQEFHPEYLGLGVEVNRYYERSPEGFEDYVVVYHEVYDDVKRVSPSTKVFPIFQLEYMRGAARLSGREHKAHWELLSRFKADLIGFTTYPFLEYRSVAEIPAGYYAEIAQHTDKPVAFTELGWPTASPHVQGGEGEQLAFLELFLNQTAALDVEFANWLFLHDGEFPNGELFNTIGLKTADGVPKQAYAAWKSLR